MEEVGCGQARRPTNRMRPPGLEPVHSPVSWPPRALPGYDVIVVGAGLAGAVIAKLLAEGPGRKVLVVDPRRSLADILPAENRDAVRSAGSPTGSGKRRRAAAYLAQVSRCSRCRGGDVPCIHPAEPEARIVERLLDHPRIDLLLGVEPAQACSAYSHQRVIEADFGGTSSEEVVAEAIAAFEQIVAGSDGGESFEAEAPIASAA